MEEGEETRKRKLSDDEEEVRQGYIPIKLLALRDLPSIPQYIYIT